MATEIVGSSLCTNRKMEFLVLMDDYGAEALVQIPISMSAEERESIISTLRVKMDATQQQLEDFATAHGHDLTSARAAGQAKKAARLAAQQQP